MPKVDTKPDTKMVTTYAVMASYRKRVERLRVALSDVQKMASAAFRGDADEDGALCAINNRCLDALKDGD